MFPNCLKHLPNSNQSNFNQFINYIKFAKVNDVIRCFQLKYLKMEDELGMQPLHYACQYNLVEIVKLFLDQKCKINKSDKCGNRPIDYACQCGHIKIVKLLLQHKCEINTSDNNKMTPLHYSCRNGDDKIVELLLEHKFNIEACNNDQMTPLHFACKYGHSEVVKLLLEHKCNIDVREHDKMTPLHFACHCYSIEIVKLLLEHKCMINVKDYLGMTPLHYACRYSQKKIIELLLERKCDVDICDNQGMTPAHIACEINNIEIVKLLLKVKCNIDASEHMKMISINKLMAEQLIDFASLRGHTDLVRLLVEHKYNIDKRNIAIVMSLDCESGCAHASCFTYLSVDDWKKSENCIGKGAFGAVYKCCLSQRSFAMKIIELKDDTKSIEKNIDKYRNIIKHDNIIQYFGSITESDRMAIFIEYMAGNSLNDRIKEQGSLPHNSIANYSRQIMMGIAFLHQQKIIHRDIKPANILLDCAGELLKLCDFGISRSLVSILTASTQNARTACGTPNYMAPEVIKDEPYSFPADIWSIGASVVEMLTGYPPFYEMKTPQAIIFKIGNLQTFEFTPVKSMSDDLKLFVYQMLQCQPSERATAKQLLESQFINLVSSNN